MFTEALILATVLWVIASATGHAEEPFPQELVDFVPMQGDALFAGTGEGTWDHKIRERGYILRDGDKWHLWYTGYEGERTAIKKLGYATSSDGFTWKRHPNNPVVDKSWTEDVHVVRHGDLFYMVAEGDGDIPHMLTSPDGVNWTDLGRLDVRNRNKHAAISIVVVFTLTRSFCDVDRTWFRNYLPVSRKSRDCEITARREGCGFGGVRRADCPQVCRARP